MNGDQVHFQNTFQNLFVSTQVTKELKIGELSLLKNLTTFVDYVKSFKICSATFTCFSAAIVSAAIVAMQSLQCWNILACVHL